MPMKLESRHYVFCRSIGVNSKGSYEDPRGAANCGNLQIGRLTIYRGADVNSKYACGHTVPVDAAGSGSGNLKVVRCLFDKGLDATAIALSDRERAFSCLADDNPG